VTGFCCCGLPFKPLKIIKMVYRQLNIWNLAAFTPQTTIFTNINLLSLRDLQTNPSELIQIKLFWNFFFHKMNPQYESFENRSTNQIYETNLKGFDFLEICKHSGFANLLF
jgi:hypothetical protein